MRALCLVPLALILGLAAACGGDDAQGGTGNQGDGAGAGADSGTDDIALDQLPRKYAAAVCEAFAGCAGNLYLVFRPGEECAKTTAVTVEEGLAPLTAAVTAGRVLYHPQRVQACLDELAAGGCDSLSRREPESCQRALEGTVEAGGDCTLDAECAGDQYCKLGDACPGKCAAYEVAGGACVSTDDCASGLECDDNGHCVAPAQKGELCQQGEPDCANGLVCLGEDSSAKIPGTCYTIEEGLSGELGDECALSGSLCQAGYACEITSTSPIEGSCVAQVEANAGCHLALPDECPESQYCKLGRDLLAAGSCTDKPGAGQKCAAGIGTATICAPYTRCDDGLCRELAHAGEDCTANDTCYSNHCVDGACVTGNSCE
jgi:hypothetical protein